MNLSVIIPSCGLTALLRFCIFQLQRSLEMASLSQWNIVIVDNATAFPYQVSDFLPDPALKILRLDRPHSFSAACNRGAAAAPAERYLFLNNDVLLHPLALREMLALAARTTAAICGTRLIYSDDTIQHHGIRFDGGKRGPYHEDHRLPNAAVPRDLCQYQAVTGAVMLIEHDLFQTLGGFDEVFPFGHEDVDFCLRARQIGKTIVCSQAVDSIHFNSTTSQGRPEAYEASRVIFFERWGGKFSIDGSEADE